MVRQTCENIAWYNQVRKQAIIFHNHHLNTRDIKQKQSKRKIKANGSRKLVEAFHQTHGVH
jgi:hypothetical protein